MIPTTAEMDGWYGDLSDMYNVWAMCNDCSEWTFIEGSHETHGDYTHNQKCSHCGSSRLERSSVTSNRTFDQERAKAKSRLVLKSNEKQRDLIRHES